MTRPKQVGLWAGLIAVTVVIAHLPSFFHRLLDGDEAIYGSIAALMNTGGQLYGPGGVDNKPPGIFWVYAAIFQAAGTYQMNAIHAVGLAVILATCGLLFVIGRDLGGVRTGLLAALFYGVLTAAGNPRLLATNTELLMMLPLTASVLLILRRQWLLSGVLLVVAGAFRQAAAANVLLAMAAILWLEPPGTRRRAAAWFSGGIAAALIAGALVLLASGSLFGFWRWTVSSLYGYASTNWIPSFVWMRAQDSLVPFVVNMAVLLRRKGWSSFGWRWQWSDRSRPDIYRGTTSSRPWDRLRSRLRLLSSTSPSADGSRLPRRWGSLYRPSDGGCMTWAPTH
jgi:hypothetical protein